MIVLDTSGLLAALLSSQRSHGPARDVLESSQRPFLLSPFVLAEVDHFLTRWAGFEAEAAFLDEVARGAYELVSFDAGAVGEARDVLASYRDLMIGLADASIVVLAGRYGTNRILTLDERHFRALWAPDGGHFTLLPADA
ncbi:MAG: PIN domain-containing protein [Gaiellaceae bacterium]